LLFEIVYPANQIVVKYDWSGLVLLQQSTTTADANSAILSQEICTGPGIIDCYAACQASNRSHHEDIDNEEGYVATWLNAAGPPLKVKIKYATYCRLHRMLTQTSPLTVWEALRDNLDLDKLSADSPAEFQTWVGSVIRDLRGKYAAIEQAALDAYLTYKPDPNLPEDVAATRNILLSMLNHNLPTLRICCSPAVSERPCTSNLEQIRPTQQYVFKTDIDT